MPVAMGRRFAVLVLGLSLSSLVAGCAESTPKMCAEGSAECDGNSVDLRSVTTPCDGTQGCGADEACVAGNCLPLQTEVQVTSGMMLGDTFNCGAPYEYFNDAPGHLGFAWIDRTNARPSMITVDVALYWNCSVGGTRIVMLNGVPVGTIKAAPVLCHCTAAKTLRTLTFSSTSSFVPGGLNTVSWRVPAGGWSSDESMGPHSYLGDHYGLVHLNYEPASQRPNRDYLAVAFTGPAP